MRTKETRDVEDFLRTVFPRTDAYRYNSASIRIRVIDERFEGKSHVRRDAMVEKLLKQLPPETQGDIVNLLTLSPDELTDLSKGGIMNYEFENPSPSIL
jgi:acid stress-induced BolA-like protein IbaG/YrbA